VRTEEIEQAVKVAYEFLSRANKFLASERVMPGANRRESGALRRQ
jgi:hypothetical protein